MIASSITRIYLLRHAKSAWARSGERDFDRSLDDEGYAEAEIVADKAADRRYRPDLILSSTALRCRQTGEALRRAIGEDLDLQFSDALYNATVAVYIEILSAQQNTGSIMLIGHNPTIEETLEVLIGPERLMAAIPTGFPTAGLAVLDRKGAAAGSVSDWQLHDFLTA